ncbi:uncharacterized protein TrAFT101_010362 [Trichoderma asperellum]|uniref:Zn(2)-C6 fungal-type domain-containing protein n=1 Tax=Trichoderma asperellum (strain ATCC 204424 / CBS 433.97 / NBRC 101777) TaxID=1042311 RepID=A0A2T3YVC3_TRIA4|nr:hypothetical protein M441DRAFT_61951 [Trichoderma asperellum CBS 433.97]PTB36477.1 hypothetical protein M441DRAFT_61951 [Trichoderma asperellum CBS 433.97]UKZ95527.1 hypothetical protein TrAFT101_010362 [Trichoderma asperellum]
MMPPKLDISNKIQQCWECLRRGLICDGHRPICDCCRSSGIVCPGCEDRRPLIWVTPGYVTVTRNRRVKVASAAASKPAISQKYRLQTGQQLLSPPSELSLIESKSSALSSVMSRSDKITEKKFDSKSTIRGNKTRGNEIYDRGRNNDEDEHMSESGRTLSSSNIIIPQTRVTSLSLVSQDRRWSRLIQNQRIRSIPRSLYSFELELEEAVDYYNCQVFPIVNSNQLFPNIYSKPFDIHRLSQLVPSNRHSLISLSIGYRILALTQIHRLSINPHNAGPASDLWTSFFRHVGLALTSLNNEIRDDPDYYLANVFRSIHLIASSELFLLNSPHWRAHVTGFLSILQQGGGLTTSMQRPGNSKFIILSFLIACVVVNTTSSVEHQIIEATYLDPKEFYNLYSVSIYPPFLCPPNLFLDVLYVNRLRLRLPTTSAIYSLPSTQVTLCDIMKRIHDFSAIGWIESSGFPNRDEFLLLSNIFQAAVALYAALTLPCALKIHVDKSCADLKQTYRAQLFNTLKAAIGSPVRMHTIYWPVVVAGVAALTGTAEERILVEEHLHMGIGDPYSGPGSLKALEILRKARASGQTEWNDCFSEPNVILFSL